MNYTSDTEDFSFKSLWDDYETRTWQYYSRSKTPEKHDPRLLNWIGSIDHSGHVREMCLRALIQNYTPGDENRILLRLTDWVPQVQELAQNWVLAHFQSLPIDAIIANQRLVLYLSNKERIQSDAGWNEIKRDLLARTRNMTATQFFGLTTRFRKFLFTLSFADDKHLRAWILDDPDPFNRLLFLKEFEYSEISSEEKQRLSTDKSLFVRRHVFYRQIEAGITPDLDDLMKFALDSNRSLREIGQFYLKRLFGKDAYEIYRTRQDETFFYIADYARASDAEHFVSGLSASSRSIQYICLKALVSTAPERLTQLDLVALISKNNKFRSLLIPLLPRLLTHNEILALRPAIEKSSPEVKIDFLKFWRNHRSGISWTWD